MIPRCNITGKSIDSNDIAFYDCEKGIHLSKTGVESLPKGLQNPEYFHLISLVGGNEIKCREIIVISFHHKCIWSNKSGSAEFYKSVDEVLEDIKTHNWYGRFNVIKDGQLVGICNVKLDGEGRSIEWQPTVVQEIKIVF